MKIYYLILGLIWLLASCGSVENTPLETLAPNLSCASSVTLDENCPWGTKLIDIHDYIKPEAMEMGPDRSVYVSGYISAPLNGPLIGQRDIFIRKYTKYGSVVWTITQGLSGIGGNAADIQVDKLGNVYIVSTYSQGLEDCFLCHYRRVRLSKYSASGVHLWTNDISDEAITYPTITDSMLAINTQGNLLLVYSHIAHYIHIYSPSGVRMDRYNLASQGPIHDIALDTNDNIYLAGGSKHCGCDSIIVLNASLQKINQSVTAKSWGWHGIAVDSQFNMVVYNSQGVKKLSPQFNVIWSLSSTSLNLKGLPSDLVLDSQNNLYIAGTINGDPGFIQKTSGLHGGLMWSSTTNPVVEVSTSGKYVYAAGVLTSSSGIKQQDTWIGRYSTGGAQQ